MSPLSCALENDHFLPEREWRAEGCFLAEGNGVANDAVGNIYYAPETISQECARGLKGRIVVIDTVSATLGCT